MAQADQEPKIGPFKSAWINIRETIRDETWAVREAVKDLRETGSAEIAATTYKAARAYNADMRDQAEMHASGDLVRTTGSTDWRIHDGGGTETKVVFGESGRGHHYMLLTSERGGEPDGAWSKPFPTVEAARDAGIDAQWRATTTGFELPQKSGPVEAPADGRRQAEADVWGGRERAGQSARAEAPKQAQRAGQNMSAGG